MIKRALQLGELMITPINTLNEDFSVSESLVNSTINDGGIFVDPIYSGKEIIITGTYFFDDRLGYIPKQNGINWEKDKYWTEIRRLAKQKVNLIAIGIDNRIYSIEVMVASIKMQEQTKDTIDFTVQCFSESAYWEDITGLTCYYCYLGLALKQELWKYQNEIKYGDTKIQDFQFVKLIPNNVEHLNLINQNNSEIKTFNSRQFTIKNRAKAKLYMYFTHFNLNNNIL